MARREMNSAGGKIERHDGTESPGRRPGCNDPGSGITYSMQLHDSENLFREWDLYAHVIEANWMRHREVTSALRSALSEGRDSLNLRVLDLGCGDGWVAENVLRDRDIAKYVGVDLSESAVSRHAQRTGPGRLPEAVEKELLTGDMAEAVKTMADQSYDVILASYSLHHLGVERKEHILDHIARVMKPGGGFFWTDVFRNESEERVDFLRRLCHEIRTRWDSISPHNRESVCDHVCQCDFPEMESWMFEETRARGMAINRRLFLDDFHGSWWFVKSVSSGH
jgi:ubiquinone/menaquinone biosynthesis C-methylase UbiE